MSGATTALSVSLANDDANVDIISTKNANAKKPLRSKEVAGFSSCVTVSVFAIFSSVWSAYGQRGGAAFIQYKSNKSKMCAN